MYSWPVRHCLNAVAVLIDMAISPSSPWMLPPWADLLKCGKMQTHLFIYSHAEVEGELKTPIPLKDDPAWQSCGITGQG